MLLFNQCAQLPFPWSFCHAANQKVQCGFQRYCHFYQQVYRSGTFSPLDSSQMAVTDVQLYGKLFLRKPVGFAGLLDTFSGGVSIKVRIQSRRATDPPRTNVCLRSDPLVWRLVAAPFGRRAGLCTLILMPPASASSNCVKQTV